VFVVPSHLIYYDLFWIAINVKTTKLWILHIINIDHRFNCLFCFRHLHFLSLLESSQSQRCETITPFFLVRFAFLSLQMNNLHPTTVPKTDRWATFGKANESTFPPHSHIESPLSKPIIERRIWSSLDHLITNERERPKLINRIRKKTENTTNESEQARATTQAPASPSAPIGRRNRTFQRPGSPPSDSHSPQDASRPEVNQSIHPPQLRCCRTSPFAVV
jgi:hypothetical protein